MLGVMEGYMIALLLKTKEKTTTNQIIFLSDFAFCNRTINSGSGYLRKGQPENCICMNMHFVLQ